MSFLARLVRRLRRSESGTAAVEFALILPVMLLVYVGTLEASTLITMDRKIQSVTGAVGDLVSRADTTLTAATLTDYFKAASGILTPYPTTDLVQVVTQVEIKTDGTTRVAWSRQYANGALTTSTKYLVNATRTIPPEMINISKGKYIIVSESSISYLPLYGIVFKTAIPLYRENYYIPRFGGTITVN